MSNSEKINKALELVAELSIDQASQVFSKILKRGAKIELERIKTIDITVATEKINKENAEVTGALVDLTGDAQFKFLFLVKTEDSFLLADYMLGRKEGATKTMDIYTSSAVQEIGNILASTIANIFSRNFQISVTPTPPEVVNDYFGTIFSEYIMSAADQANQILMIETRFLVVNSDIRCNMYMLPMPGSEDILGD